MAEPDLRHSMKSGPGFARVAIAKPVANSERLSGRDSRDAGALHLLALAKEVQAQILADLKRFPESFQVGDAVLAVYRRLVSLSGNAAGTRRSMAAAMRTTGGNHYNGRDYAGACTLWRDTLALYRQLDKEGALSDADRKGSMAEMID
jgi:eukaryotic-like serine/threonine-protein kinase